MENRLKEIIISVTNRCNLRCSMCQIPLADKGEMSTEELKGLVSDSSSLRPNSIVFSGGEPLLREDIFDLISFAGAYKINTCLTSNGMLINDAVADKLVSSGVSVVNISIEGPEQIHDSLRGRGSFNKAVQALKCLSRYKIEATIAATVSRINYKTLPYVMELAYKLGVTTVKFQPFSEIFLVEKNRKNDFLLSPDTLAVLEKNMEKIVWLSKKYKICTNPDTYLYNIPKYLCGLQSSLKYHCSAVWRSCPISQDGNVYLCWVLTDKIIGNVRKRRLSDIWNSAEHKSLCESVEKSGCSGCMMSCYDYNSGKYGISRLFQLKVAKLKDRRFYKRLYYRNYQYICYLAGKIFNRLADSAISCKNSGSRLDDALKEIALAKQVLKDKIRSIEKADKEEGKC